MTHPIHHLEIICRGCEVRVKLNDMPIARLRAPGPDAEHFAPPINPYLVGEENVIEIEVAPLAEGDDLGKAEIDLAVRKFAKGEAVAPGQGPAVLEVAIHDELRERIREAQENDTELDLPQTFYQSFDNEGPSFSEELLESTPFTDESALRDYAIHLRDLAAQKDADGLIAEMEPKIQAFMAAYDEPREPFYESLLSGLRDEFLPAGIDADFGRDDVMLAPACGGRLWNLTRRGAPLLQTRPDENGNTMQHDILVAPRDGALKVVR
jgi:hypothetical protein